MASRNPRPRIGTNAAAGARGLCRPALTRTQILRQAKTAAAAAVREARPREDPCPSRRQRTSLARVGPPPADPKRLDFSKPSLNKAMLARMQHAQKLKMAEEQKNRQEQASMRRSRKVAAPVCGDARTGRVQNWQPEGTLQEAAMRSPTVQKLMRNREQRAKAAQVGLSGLRNRESAIPGISRQSTATSDAANRSIQVIQETLDEQDQMEAAIVQNKLEGYQNARRDLVLACANVSLSDDVTPPFSPNSPPVSPLAYIPGPLPTESPPRVLQRVPDLSDPFLQVEYGKYHPSVATAREYLKRTQAAQATREAQRRIDEEFARAAACVEDDDLRLDIPLEQDLMEGDISFEEDEDGTLIPCVSRIKASMPYISQRTEPYHCRATEIEELERFFDTTNYPPVASTFAPPAGRDTLNPDLWDLEDPWQRECPQPEGPDLMEFDLMDF